MIHHNIACLAFMAPTSSAYMEHGYGNSNDKFGFWDNILYVKKYNGTLKWNYDGVTGLFLVVIFIVLPSIISLIRCVIWRNVPKWDLFLAYTSLIWWPQVLFYTWLTYSCVQDRSPIHYSLIIIICLLSTISIIAAVISPCTYSGDCWYNYNKGCSGIESIKMHPVPRNVSVEEMEKLIKTILKTGPTMVCGFMYQKGSKKVGNTTIYFWTVESWEQFVYRSWKNELIEGLDEVQENINLGKTFVIRIIVEIEPKNLATDVKYNDWHGLTEPHFSWCWKTSGSRGYKKLCSSSAKFLEEVITVPELGSEHKPANTVPSIQLPHLAKIEESQSWPTSSDR